MFEFDDKGNDNVVDLYKDTKDQLQSYLIKLIKSAKDSGIFEEIDRAIESDPELKKSYEDYIKNNNRDQFGKDATSYLISMLFDTDMQREMVESYEFPYQRTHPRILRDAGKSIPARLIKAFRYMQLNEFAQVSDGKNPGFKFVTSDPDRKLKDSEKKILNRFEDIFANHFFFLPNDPKANLAKFLQYAYNDYFDLDKIAIEVERERASANVKSGFRGKPLGFHIVDGALVHHIIPKEVRFEDRFTDIEWQFNRIRTRWDRKEYQSLLAEAGVQYYYIDEYRFLMVDRNGQLRAKYTEDRMILSHAHGTTDVEDQFMGCSVVEQAINIMRYIVDSIIYNYSRRSANVMPKGMIALIGGTSDGFSREEMTLFRKLIWGIAAGKGRQWKYPVVGLPEKTDAKFIKFHESSQQMEDFLWVSTLFSWLCVLSGTDPESISMASNKNAMGKQRLFDKKEEGPMLRSQDQGLRFFLKYFADIISSSGIIEEMTGLEGIVWAWQGLDVEDEIKKAELIQKELQSYKSLNDLLAEKDLKTINDLMIEDINIFDIPGIANPTMLQLIILAINSKRQESMSAQQAQGGESPFGFLGEKEIEEEKKGKEGEETEEKEEVSEEELEKSFIEIIVKD